MVVPFVYRCLTGLNATSGAFELGSRIQENRVALTEFLAEPFVTVIPTTPGVARHYGRVYAALRRAGTPVPANDRWIAAARSRRAPVLSPSTRASRAPGLDCIVLET